MSPEMTPVTPAEVAPLPSFQPTAWTAGWIFPSCAQCGKSAGQSVLQVPHPDAPGGMSHVWKCAGCGLRRLQPRPGPDIIGHYYQQETGYNAFEGRRRSARAQAVWDFLRDSFSRPRDSRLSARLARPIAAFLARWLFDINVRIDGRQGLRVLEVGSGYGDILMYLRSRGCAVLGTDLSPSAAAKAGENGVEVRVGNLVDLQLPRESFDAAIMSHSLEHVPDPNAELRELHRILVPGGRLHIAVPNGAAVRLVTDGKEWMHLSHPYHFWYFDPDNLVSMVRRHGFEPVAPPQTTTRHHALGLWRAELRTRGVLFATRRFLRFLRGSLSTPQGGDVLRLVCRRVS